MVARSEGQAEVARGRWLFLSALQAPVCSPALVMQPVTERRSEHYGESCIVVMEGF